MGFKAALVGCGRFGSQFIGQLVHHPEVDDVLLADSHRDRAVKYARKWGVDDKNIYNSLEEILETDVDAVAIFSQRHLHGPQAIKALKAGKHVLCAVPMATDVEDIKEILRLVEEKRLIYMTNETDTYVPAVMYCRERYKAGDFGRFTYGETSYNHDMSHFIDPFTYSGGKDWKRVAGFPPLFYSTHTVSRVLSITGAHITKVAAYGMTDYNDDEIFRAGNNNWDNPYSNETALMRTSDGGVIRINEFRRVVKTSNDSMFKILGDNGMYSDAGSHKFAKRAGEAGELKEEVDVTELMTTGKFDGEIDQDVPVELRKGFFSGFAPFQNKDRLPEGYKKVMNGHNGSHHFLIDDFCRSVAQNKLPAYKDAWQAAKYCLPGIIAHESAMKGGVSLDVPYLGEPPADWDILNLDEGAFDGKIWADNRK